MLTPSLNTVMTRLLIVAAVLATLVLFAPAASAQSDEPIEFPENSTDPVRVFTSTDPEGAGIDWDVTGLDAADFTIVTACYLISRAHLTSRIPRTDPNQPVDLTDEDEDDDGEEEAVSHGQPATICTVRYALLSGEHPVRPDALSRPRPMSRY